MLGNKIVVTVRVESADLALEKKMAVLVEEVQPIKNTEIYIQVPTLDSKSLASLLEKSLLYRSNAKINHCI
ncbi:MAG: hypothetical protein K0R50_1269 [Eubacterium sp.]|jgi:hypothetical protein|nr:hypothetical protein [Eubacterium sp.]